MFPARTTYHVARKPAEYKKIYRFCRAESEHEKAKADGFNQKATKIETVYPTVYGLRDGKVIGLLGSQLHQEYGLIAYPFHVKYDIPNHVPTVLRLLDCYEHVLIQAGISHYLILAPSWKPSSKRVLAGLRGGTHIYHFDHNRLDLYQITVGT